MINDISNNCNSLDDIVYCLQIGLLACGFSKYFCQLLNCEECEICDYGMICKSCKPNYHLANNSLYCYNETTGSAQLDYNNIFCHPNCLNCSSFFNNGNMNCISCKDNFYKINGTDNCFDETLLSKGFYLKNFLFYQCDDNCLTCLDEKNETSNNCLSCDNETRGLYLLEDKNNCEYNNISGYYLNNDTKILQKCYNNCKTCNGPYEINNETNIENHNCIECAENYYKLSNSSYHNNCYAIDTTNSWKNIEETILNISYTSLINIEFITIPTCNLIEKPIIQLISSEEFKSKITENITEFLNSTEIINGSDFKAVILSSDDLNPQEQLKKGISAVDLGNCTQIIKKHYNISENENLLILNMESKKNQSNKDIEDNNNDNSFDIGKNVQIEVFDNSGRKLDLSVCQEDIQIMQYIKDVEELDINSAIALSNKGIDVFIASDGYFNDICHETNDDKDIIIKDRRSDIYQNVTFCQKGCIYKGIDYNLVAANCICDSSFLQGDSSNNNTRENNNKEEKLNFKIIKESFISNLFDFNINVLYCYNLVFNLKLIKNNIGFFSMMILLFFQIIFFLIYLMKKLEPLKDFMLSFKKNSKIITKSFPPHKNKDNSIKNYSNEIKAKNNKKLQYQIDNNNLENINGKDLINLKSFFSKPDINKNENNFLTQNDGAILTSKFAPTINIQNPIININNNKIITRKTKKKKKKRYKLKESNKKLLIQDSTLSNNELKKNSKNIDNTIKNKDLINLETIGEPDKNNGKKSKTNLDVIKLSRSDEDLLDMDYEHAIIFDKRNYLRIYWGILLDTQIILDTFCTENYLNLFIIKLSFMICNFQINFFLNAFFYTDDYISSAYHNNGVLDFFSGLPKSIYSFLLTLMITNLLKMLSNNKSELARVIRNKRKDNNYIHFINNKLRKLQNKIIIYHKYIILILNCILILTLLILIIKYIQLIVFLF